MNGETMRFASRSQKVRLSLVAIASAAVISIAGIAGCSGSSSSSSASSRAAASSAASSSTAMVVSDVGVSSAAAKTDLTIGSSSSGSASIVIVNELGLTVKDIAFCANAATGELSYLMKDDQAWESGKTALVNYEKRAQGVNYDIHLKAGDGEVVLHDLDLNGVKELTMRVDNGVAFATFERDGSIVSSQQRESDLARQMGTVLPTQQAQSAQEEQQPAQEEPQAGEPQEAQPEGEPVAEEGA